MAAATLAALSSAEAQAPAGPANDNFANAIALAAGSSTVDGTAATAQPGEPPHYTHGGSLKATHSVWWKFVSPFNGFIQIDTAGSAYDTVLSVYTGSKVTALSRVAQNDDADVTPPVKTSLVSIAVTKGVTYHIAVDGFSSDVTGSTTLNITYLRINSAKTYEVALTDAPSSEDNGLLVFSTTSSSLVTGKVITGTHGYPFTAAVSVDGHLIASVDRPGLAPVLMDLTVGTDYQGNVFGPAAGAVAVGQTSSSVTAYPAISYTNASPCPRAGRYNYAVNATGAVGYGVASVTVSKTGVCTSSGTLADGSAFVFSAPLLDNSGSANSDIGTGGSYCYHSVLSHAQGQITGSATFDATKSPVAVGGSLLWYRPAPKVGTAFLPYGIFGSSVTTFGNQYLPPTATHRVDPAFDVTSGACTLDIASLDFPAVSAPLTLSTSNTFPAGVAPNLINLKVATATGIVSGTVKLINSPTSYKIASVLGIVVNYPGFTPQFYGFAGGITGTSTVLIHP